jgi:hypothetical protein
MHEVNDDHASYDALRFPVLFPHGIMGWHRAMKSNETVTKIYAQQRRRRLELLVVRPYQLLTSHDTCWQLHDNRRDLFI